MSLVPKFFITNRFPRQSPRSRADRKFVFDLANNDVSAQMYFCHNGKDGEHTEVLSTPLLDAISQSGYRNILLYVHGFNTMPDGALDRAAKLQALCDKRKAKEVLVVPMIWPCDNDLGIIKDYWDDQRAARASAVSFARILQAFLRWRAKNAETLPSCMKNVSIITHSMGNLLLSRGLEEFHEEIGGSAMPFIFRNAFLMAADIPNDTLEVGRSGELISKVSEKVVVYHAIDDLALQASIGANSVNSPGKRRLGTTGPKDMRKVPANVYEVNYNGVNSAYDHPTGHTYFLSPPASNEPGQVFKHVFQCMEKGQVFAGDTTVRSLVLVETA